MFSLEVKSGHDSAHPFTVDGHEDAVGDNNLCLLFERQFQRVPREFSSGGQVCGSAHFVDEVIEFRTAELPKVVMTIRIKVSQKQDVQGIADGPFRMDGRIEVSFMRYAQESLAG